MLVMSSPALHCSQEDLLARWMPCSSRAGVILSPCADVAPLGERRPRSASPEPDDSFSAHFGPLSATADSSCVAPESLHLLIDMEQKQAGHEQQRDTAEDTLEEMTAQSHDVPLVEKLEQLRQWQQHMQQQLRAQQLQELLRLQQEQHRMLGLVSPHHSEAMEELSGPERGDSALGTGCHLQKEEQEGSAQPTLTFPNTDQQEEQLENQSSGFRPSAQQPEHDDGNAGGETAAADRPIRPGSGAQRTFEEMLEEQLRQEEKRLKCVNPLQSVPGAEVPLACPKRAFLRRGEGLLRFSSKKANVQKNSRPLAQATAIACYSAESISVDKRQSSCGPRQRKTATVSLAHRPTTLLFHQPKAALFEESQSHLQLHASQPQTVQRVKEGVATRGPVACGSKASEGPQGETRDTQEWWFKQQLQHWESARQEESVELGEFELLEQAAEELSFSSNSSFVLKVLQKDLQKQLSAEGLPQRRLSSTPVKSPLEPQDPSSLKGPTEGGATEDTEWPQQVHQLCESQEDPAKQQVPSCSSVYSCQPPYDKHTYEDHSLSLSDIGDSDERTVTEHPKEPSRVLFDDQDTWSQLSPEHSVTTDSPGELASPPECVFTRNVAVSKTVEQDAQSDGPSPSQLMSKLFPALNTHPYNPPATTELSSSPPNTHTQQAQPQLLKERLAELEFQIQRFQKENAALSKLRKDNHRVQEELRKERSEFEQMKVQEMSLFEEYKREETRKLQRERKLFEKHLLAARAVPNKGEREEIQALKQQLSSVQEELRRKESRWTNTHNRLRRQLEAVGQDNSALHQEVKTLEKLRITTWKKNCTDSDKTSAAKGVKFATPLDSTSSRGSRRASAPGGTAETKGTRVKSSLRRPSLTVGTVEETEPEEQNQSSPVPEAPGCEPPPAQEDAVLSDGKSQAGQQLSSGARLIVFPNGTKKEVSSDGKTLKVTFFNGDTKEVTSDQRVIYYYAEAKTTHITYQDGLEVLLFPNNQTEKHFPDGRKEITFPDQTIKTLYPNGREESVLTDGTIIQVHLDGRKEIHFNTGQREVHTAEYKRREYPDGTVKIVYSNGRQETCYPSGRLRIKDQEGNVILDTS